MNNEHDECEQCGDFILDCECQELMDSEKLKKEQKNEKTKQL